MEEVGEGRSFHMRVKKWGRISTDGKCNQENDGRETNEREPVQCRGVNAREREEK